MLKLDTLGNIEWTRSIGGPNRDGIPVVALAKDSNYIIATSYSYKTVFGASEIDEFKIQVLKIDKSDGSTIWDKQYDTIRNAVFPSMVKINNNEEIIIIGEYFSYETISSCRRSWILKLNQILCIF